MTWAYSRCPKVESLLPKGCQLLQHELRAPLPRRNHDPMHNRAAQWRPAVRLGIHLRPKGYSRAQVTLHRIAVLHCSGEVAPCRPTDRSATPRRGTELCSPGRGARAAAPQLGLRPRPATGPPSSWGSSEQADEPEGRGDADGNKNASKPREAACEQTLCITEQLQGKQNKPSPRAAQTRTRPPPLFDAHRGDQPPDARPQAKHGNHVVTNTTCMRTRKVTACCVAL